MNQHVTQLYDWCHVQRVEAEKALDLYERGVMRFRVNHVDVTEEQKASLRRIIGDMTNLIERIETDQREFEHSDEGSYESLEFDFSML